MGTLKTTNIQSISGSGTVTLGTSGETFTVPSGVTVNMSSATQTGVGGTNSSLFMATLSANQTISANTWTKITLDQEIYDPDGVFGSNKFTVPSTGYYALFAGARIDSPNAGENCSINLYKNGSWYAGSTEDRRFANTNGHELF